MCSADDQNGPVGLTWDERLKAVLNDTRSGSSHLSRRLKDLLPDIPDDRFSDTARELLSRHASMAALINMINREFLRREGISVDSSRQGDDRVLAEFWRRRAEARRWITLSNSYWVTRCFNRCPQTLDIEVGISHPQEEGEITAARLRTNHRVEVIDDLEIPLRVEHCDSVLIGADLVSEDIVVNKIGSFALALAADYFKKPCLVITSGDKELHPDLMVLYRFRTIPWKGRQVQLFETVPRHLVTAVIWTTPPHRDPVSRGIKAIARTIQPPHTHTL